MADFLRALNAVIRVEELLFLGLFLTWGMVLFTLKADSKPGKR